MEFSVYPKIKSAESLEKFFSDWSVGEGDLLITNEYLLTPQLHAMQCPCDTLFQEKFGAGEPNDEMIDAMLAAAEGREYQRVIALGGGTVIDISKLLVFGGGLSCEEIFANGAKLARKRSLVIIPTTCGTGSEVTGISIVEFKAKETKIGLAVPTLFADEAVLIPEILTTLPFEVFATSSIDAFIHAVESTLSPKASSLSRAMGRSAIEMILRGYKKLAAGAYGALPEAGDMAAFLEASTMAGIAFGNAGCAAVHALSYPIGGAWHVPHGKANYIVFEAVLAAYVEKGAQLTALTDIVAGALGCCAGDAINEMFALLGRVYPNTALGSYGADELKCAEMSALVIANQQRLLVNSPVELSEAEIANIYMKCL